MTTSSSDDDTILRERIFTLMKGGPKDIDSIDIIEIGDGKIVYLTDHYMVSKHHEIFKSYLQLKQLINVNSVDHRKETKDYLEKNNIKYYWYPFDDHPAASYTMLNVAKLVHKDIQYPCLIHCAAGVSRSVSMVIYLLMKECSLSANEALKKIRLSRSVVNPNYGFMDILRRGRDLQVVKSLPPPESDAMELFNDYWEEELMDILDKEPDPPELLKLRELITEDEKKEQQQNTVTEDKEPRAIDDFT